MSVLAGRYHLLEQVGEGGMGVVWRAHDEQLERDVAIKLLRPFLAAEPELRRRFDREARTLASLASEYIVRVFDYVNDGERAFLVLEYVDGSNLAQASSGRLPLPLVEAACYGRPVAHALAYAHARGVVHRDLTPANILIESTSGRVVTSDFGLARIARSSGSLTAAGTLLGTPEYWSPEQALGHDTTAACDLYAFGCILFLLLSGRLPFEGDDRLGVGLRRAHEDAPSLAVASPAAPLAAVDLVDSLLAREPAHRPDAAEAAAALGRVSGNSWPRRVLAASSTASAKPTLALPSERSTLVNTSPPATVVTAAPARGRERRRLRGSVTSLAAAAALTTGIVVALFFAAWLAQTSVRTPSVISLSEGAARARILRALPSAAVSVSRVYSTRVAKGRVLAQRPAPGSKVSSDARITLTISAGSPFAAVPEVAAGTPPELALAALVHGGFRGHYSHTPSWTVRKGTLIAFEPSAGTRLRRPAAVSIILSSGYPRRIVPKVENTDLAIAERILEQTHLHYRIVHKLEPNLPPNQVLREIPAAGVSVYEGSRIRLTVTRTLRWVRLLAASGGGAYESAPFTVPARWRIRYRLRRSELGIALVQFSWSRDGELPDGRGFLAHNTGTLQTYAAADGPGTYRIAVNPFLGTDWYVEIDALE
jgi:eukaryotic-like serine/threonine-protein kinase